MNDYTEITPLESIYLEDSWVLGIEVAPGVVNFSVDFVLTPQHPDYAAPAPNEVHRVRRGVMQFAGVTNLTWLNQQQRPGKDADGEEDFGNIDAMKWEPNHFVLEGSWGEMDLFATDVSVTF